LLLLNISQPAITIDGRVEKATTEDNKRSSLAQPLYQPIAEQKCDKVFSSHDKSAFCVFSTMKADKAGREGKQGQKTIRGKKQLI